MIPGVVASCLPDLDVLGSFFTDPASNLYTHRGLTHSFFAITFFAFAGAYLTYKWIQSDIKLKKWWWMWILLLLSHILLDSLNNYGIGWWEPFSHQRISFDILYVADPLFSFWPAIVIMVIILYPAGRNFKYSLWIVGMSASFIYLSHCFINKKIIDHKVEAVLKQNGINHDSYLTTPAPFQNWLWFVVVKVKDVYYTGFASVFEGNEKLTFEKFDQNDSLVLVSVLAALIQQRLLTHEISAKVSIPLTKGGWSRFDTWPQRYRPFLPRELAMALRAYTVCPCFAVYE